MTHDRTKPTWLATWGLETPETEAKKDVRLQEAQKERDFLEKCADEWIAAETSTENSLIGDHKAFLEDQNKDGVE